MFSKIQFDKHQDPIGVYCLNFTTDLLFIHSSKYFGRFRSISKFKIEPCKILNESYISCVKL